MKDRIRTAVISVGLFLIVVMLIDKFTEGTLPACNSKKVHRSIKELIISKIPNIEDEYKIDIHTVSHDKADRKVKEFRLCSAELKLQDKKDIELKLNIDFIIDWESKTDRLYRIELIK